MTVSAVSHAKFSSAPNAPCSIHNSRDRFKMKRVDTGWNTTKMIHDFGIAGPIPCCQEPADNMRAAQPPHPGDGHVLPAAMLVETKPAWAEMGRVLRDRPVEVDVYPEAGDALFEGILAGHLEPPIPGDMRSDVSASRPPYSTTKPDPVTGAKIVEVLTGVHEDEAIRIRVR